MRLETDRLLLREWEPLRDAQQAFDIYSDSEVTRWLDSEADSSIHATQGRLQRYRSRSSTGLGIWAVVEKDIGRIIGTLLLVPLPGVDGQPTGKIEIGWHFRRASWGYGYATEAARPVLAYGLTELALPAVYAVALPDNHRSTRVMARLGMEPVGLTQQYHGGHELVLYRAVPQG